MRNGSTATPIPTGHYNSDEDSSIYTSNTSQNTPVATNGNNHNIRNTDDLYDVDNYSSYKHQPNDNVPNDDGYYSNIEQPHQQQPSYYNNENDNHETYHSDNNNKNNNNTPYREESQQFHDTDDYNDERRYQDNDDNEQQPSGHYNHYDDPEQDALFRNDSHESSSPPPPHRKQQTCGQRMKQCCSTCYIPKCDYRGPCRFPHGCCYSILGIMSAVGGLMMNLYVVGTCLFQRIQLVDRITLDVIKGQQRGYGFLSRETEYGVESDYRQCTWYPQDEYNEIFDVWMQTGRFFAFASAILATVCFIIMMMTCCVAFSRSMFEKWLFWMYITAALLVSFSFFIFGSEFCKENDCKVADGCGWAISAFMFHLLAANTVKSFPMANAPNHKRPRNRRNRNNDDGDDDDDDDDDDDLYYETEEDKYPPMRPEGPRGVKTDKDGVRSFDDGEDYFNDMGEMIDPNDPEGLNKKKKSRRANEDDENYDDDLDDVSDHDLEEYASDNDDDDDDNDQKRGQRQQCDANGNPIYNVDGCDDEEEMLYNVDVDDDDDNNDPATRQQQQYDAFGNPIYDLDMIADRGNLGVGYENDTTMNQNNDVFFDEYGQPMQHQQHQQSHPSPYDNRNTTGYEPQEAEQLSGFDDFGNTNYNFDRRDGTNDENEDQIRKNPFEEEPQQASLNHHLNQQSFVSNDSDDDTRSYPSFATTSSTPTSSSTAGSDQAIHDNGDTATSAVTTNLGQEQRPTNQRYSTVDNDDDDSYYSGPVFT